MDFDKAFGVDDKKATEGVWFPVGDGKVLIARWGTPTFQKVLRKKTQLLQTRLQKRQLDDDETEQALTEVMAECILLGWENFTHNGKVVKHTTENALKLLKKFPDFRDFVAENAQRMDVFKKEGDASTEGNSSGHSNGSEDGENTQDS